MHKGNKQRQEQKLENRRIPIYSTDKLKRGHTFLWVTLYITSYKVVKEKKK